MACTCLGETHGSSRCYETNDPEKCANMGLHCQYSEGSCPPDSSAVVMSQQLSTPFPDDPGMEAIYKESIDSLYEVRDLIRGSDVGNLIIQYNDDFAQDAISLVERYPDLAKRITRVLVQATSFGRAMLLEQASDGKRHDKRTFSREQFDEAVNVADEIKKFSGRDELAYAIDELRSIAEGFVGLTPSESLEKLRPSTSTY